MALEQKYEGESFRDCRIEILEMDLDTPYNKDHHVQEATVATAIGRQESTASTSW